MSTLCKFSLITIEKQKKVYPLPQEKAVHATSGTYKSSEKFTPVENNRKKSDKRSGKLSHVHTHTLTRQQITG